MMVRQLLLCFKKISKNKIPSSQAKDGLTYDGISGETNNSSAFSITEMLTKVKDLYGDPYIDENTGRLKEVNDRYYTKVCVILQFKRGKMGSFKCRIKFFSDEIFMEREL